MDNQKLEDFYQALYRIEEAVRNCCASDAIEDVIYELKRLQKYGFMEGYDEG